MANDPNRDLLPVREDGWKTGKGTSDKFDYQILGKLSRGELEDRFLRLVDEQTHIKKLANNQEEKIRRLGTKLLRLVNEKKNGKKLSEQNKETEDLNLRIVELEHENYLLNDKNTVLKQQLSNYSRHLSHRSPVLSNHTSPLMTMRQSASRQQRESTFEAGQKNEPAEVQLQEAEAHIKDLNDEIKSLHLKIDFLQQNLEKNNLDNRKIKVTENIELIRLQRSLKQQGIQIAALREQVTNSEKTQKGLKEDLTKAHNENDEALHLISVKQNEILNLFNKLEESSLNKLEEDELKERINDLMVERDSLKERNDFLMKSISPKTEESEKIAELEKLLAEEKAKKEKLEETLDMLKNNFRESSTAIVETSCCEKIKTVFRAQQTTPEKEVTKLAIHRSEDTESSRSQDSSLCRDLESDTDPSEVHVGKITVKKTHCREGKYIVEKMKLELELQYLREMLRTQTLRCEAQQSEISRLMYELKLNEDKCNETLQRLELHLRIFESFELRGQRIETALPKTPEPVQDAKPEKVEPVESPRKKELIPERRHSSALKNVCDNRNSTEECPRRLLPHYAYIPSKSIDETGSTEKFFPDHESKKRFVDHDPKKRQVEPNNKKRFVDQTFLYSSDEEIHKKEPEFAERVGSGVKNVKLLSADAEMEKSVSDSSLPTKPYERDTKKERPTPTDDGFSEDHQNLTVTIMWFKIKADSSLWQNKNIEMFFVDFIFLDMNGAETETPQSLHKPRNPDTKCDFNFTQNINVTGNRMKMLQKLVKNPDSGLFIFKVVSDSEKFDGTNDDCEDIGVGVITVREFFVLCNKGPFQIQVRNNDDSAEVIGTLGLSIEAPPRLLATARGL